MKRFTMLLVAGVFTIPAVGWADNFFQPLSNYTMGTCQFLDCGNHLGTDRMASENTNVIAISRGYAVYYDSDAGSFGGCNVDGVALWVKHRKESGQYFWALYGHIKSVTVSVQENQVITANITPGQHIAEIADYYPCYNLNGNCGTSHCPHLHFGIWDNPIAPCGEQGSTRCSQWGYGSQGSFVDPNAFLTDEHPYPEGPTYIADYLRQNESVTPWMAPNTSRTMWVDYQNDGTATWTSGVTLRSLTGAVPCVLTNGCAYDPADWMTQQTITTANQSSVAPTATARFQFQVKAATSTGSCVQWVAPWVPSSTCMNGWGGVNFTIRTDATVPQGTLASGTPQPGTYTSDITIGFVVNDAHSGGRGYAVGWDNPSIGGPEVSGTSGTTTLAPRGGGSHTLYLRVWDAVGNTTMSNLGVYTYQTGPCGTREIPRCWNPPHGPDHCIPAASAQTQLHK